MRGDKVHPTPVPRKEPEAFVEFGHDGAFKIHFSDGSETLWVESLKKSAVSPLDYWVRKGQLSTQEAVAVRKQIASA